MGVKLPYRHRGVGRALLNHFIDELKARGASNVSLNTEPSLVPAITLYESEGFKREGTVISTSGLELIIFSKNLT
jgi:ribosomal protein S18 acetylase RimI-like enzyme